MKTLGIWSTLGWALLCFAVAQAVGILIIWMIGQMPTGTTVQYDGRLVALVTLIPNPVLVVLLAVVAWWRTGGNAAEYLGLVRFSGREFLVGFLAVAALAAAMDVVSSLAGLDIVSPFQTESYATARATGWILPLMLAIIVIGPVGEEVLFRGFLFRGWIRPGVPGVVAVAVISLLWAALHVQYDPVGMTQVFLSGLLLGWIRWRSGSTLLTIVLHLLVNLEATIETAAKIGWSAT
ncbi:MAG TPA: CPBP family intramembrane glutamic endopeptidase [Xanthobacteraceae bacterium]